MGTVSTACNILNMASCWTESLIVVVNAFVQNQIDDAIIKEMLRVPTLLFFFLSQGLTL